MIRIYCGFFWWKGRIAETRGFGFTVVWGDFHWELNGGLLIHINLWRPYQIIKWCKPKENHGG